MPSSACKKKHYSPAMRRCATTSGWTTRGSRPRRWRDGPLFFFLMVRPPPRSTLFPYTTLFPISSSGHLILVPWLFGWNDFDSASVEKAFRSEEHTSELQSHVNLVCRLLLEK